MVFAVVSGLIYSNLRKSALRPRLLSCERLCQQEARLDDAHSLLPHLLLVVLGTNQTI